MLQLWPGMHSSGELCQIEQKRMMTFGASDCHLVQQGMKLVAHYRHLSHLSCLLICRRLVSVGDGGIEEVDMRFEVFLCNVSSELQKACTRHSRRVM